MLAFPSALKIYLAVAPVDMRQQFNGLWFHAQSVLKTDPREGAVFVFANKKHDRVKLLYWDGTGVCVLANTHESQCPQRVSIEAALSVSSAIRRADRSFRRSRGKS